MSTFKIELSGLKDVEKVFKNYPKALEKEIAAELNFFGENVERDAKTLAPVDEGHLKSSISYTKAAPGKLNVEIIVATDYAPYIEFGTRKFAERYVSTLPQDWQTFAATFKGKGGGTVEDMLERLTAWVMRKGFAAHSTKSGARSKSKTSIRDQENAAYIIALRILQNGVRAHPFLYPAVTKNRPALIAALNDLIK